MNEKLIGEISTGQGAPHRMNIAQYDALKARLALIDLAFWIACMTGPLLIIGGLLVLVVIVRPVSVTVDHPVSLVLPIMASILVMPLYKLRGRFQRHVADARAKLENMATPVREE